MSEITSDFDKFFALYPRPTGIGAARRAFINQIMFKGALPEQMIAAAKRFRELKSDVKTEFIPYPAKWLEDETYRDADLQTPAAPLYTGWRKRLADYLGEKVVQTYLEHATFEDGILTLNTDKGWILKRQYEAKLMMAGVREVV